MTANNTFIRMGNLPPYGSLIIEKNSGGLGGELYINENDRAFFNTTGNIIREQGKNATSTKQIYELNNSNIYTFDFDNLLAYLYEIKNEFSSHDLCPYKSFVRESDKSKRVDEDGWNSRKDLILSRKDDLSFSVYLKKSTNGRCFLGSNESEGLYYRIIAYTVIPNYTTMTIEKEIQSDGSSKFIFRLFFNLDNQAITEDVQKQKKKEAKLRHEQSTEDLIKAAIKKELHRKENEPAASATNPNAGKNTRRKVFTDYDRDETISAAVKSRAKGKCDLCEQPAPFKDEYDQPFLEEHHVEWLMNGGSDSIDNAVALCPNCHRKMHIVNDVNDVTKLRDRLSEYANLYSTIIAEAKS